MLKLTALLLALASPWSTPTDAVQVEGQAKLHNWIPETAEYRDMDLGRYAGGVAVMRRGDLGRVVWVEVEGRWYGPFLAVDCAAERHYAGRVAQGDVVELSARWWDLLDLPLAPVAVTVRFAPPPDGVRWQ
jgi:hypothetical protein